MRDTFVRMKTILVVALIVATIAVACVPSCPPSPPVASGGTTLSVANGTDTDAVVYFAFGSDSVVVPATWKAFCAPSAALNCIFTIAAHSERSLPLTGQYLNATVSFNAAVTCGTTKAEVNVNNPKWYDVLDVSLVDGFSNEIEIAVTTPTAKTLLGPPHGAFGNEKVLGVFPLGCDICVARQKPPCGMSPGADGCKTGTQYKPDVPCQWQGPTMGGGESVQIRLTKLVPGAK
jgi:hypothetical protein